MFYLPQSVEACNKDTFSDTFKNEILTLDATLLPLQQGLRYSSMAITDSLSISILNIKLNETDITVKAGLFYTGTIAGCNCSDDPSVSDVNNEYCEVTFSINKDDAHTTVAITN